MPLTPKTSISPLRKLVTNTSGELVQIRRKLPNSKRPEAFGWYALASSALDFLNLELQDEDEGVLAKTWSFDTGISGFSFLEQKDAVSALGQSMTSLRSL